MFLILSSVTITLQFIGIVLMFDPPEQKTEMTDKSENEINSVMDLKIVDDIESINSEKKVSNSLGVM